MKKDARLNKEPHNVITYISISKELIKVNTKVAAVYYAICMFNKITHQTITFKELREYLNIKSQKTLKKYLNVLMGLNKISIIKNSRIWIYEENNKKNYILLPIELLYKINNIKELQIYISLKSFYNTTDGKCNPGIRKLAEVNNMRKEKVIESLNFLKENKLISWKKRGRRGRNYEFI